MAKWLINTIAVNMTCHNESESWSDNDDDGDHDDDKFFVVWQTVCSMENFFAPHLKDRT